MLAHCGECSLSQQLLFVKIEILAPRASAVDAWRIGVYHAQLPRCCSHASQRLLLPSTNVEDRRRTTSSICAFNGTRAELADSIQIPRTGVSSVTPGGTLNAIPGVTARQEAHTS